MLAVRTLATAVAVLALAIAGCGGDDNDGGGGGGASDGGGSKEAKLAFVYPTTTTNFAQEMALGAKAAADDTPGVNLTESAPANVDGPKHVQLFQAAVSLTRIPSLISNLATFTPGVPASTTNASRTNTKGSIRS